MYNVHVCVHTSEGSRKKARKLENEREGEKFTLSIASGSLSVYCIILYMYTVHVEKHNIHYIYMHVCTLCVHNYIGACTCVCVCVCVCVCGYYYYTHPYGIVIRVTYMYTCIYVHYNIVTHTHTCCSTI